MSQDKFKYEVGQRVSFIYGDGFYTRTISHRDLRTDGDIFYDFVEGDAAWQSLMKEVRPSLTVIDGGKSYSLLEVMKIRRKKVGND